MQRSHQEALTPILASLFMVGSAVLLTVGFYAAVQVARANDGDRAPNIGWWDEPADDRFLVVTVDRDADWGQLTARTDRPARVSLDGAPGLLTGIETGPGGAVPLAPAVRPLNGGDAVAVCALGPEGIVELTILDRASGTLVLQRSLHVRSCT